MQIEEQTCKFRVKVELSVGNSPQKQTFQLDDRINSICIGRLTGPIKKVKNWGSAPGHTMMVQGSQYISNEHCLLRVEAFDFQKAQEFLLTLSKYFHKIPRDLLREILKYVVKSYTSTIQDLNSTSGTFACLNKTQFLCGQCLFIENTHAMRMEPLEIHYMHHPQQTTQYETDKKTARLINLIKNAFHLEMNENRAQCLNWSHGLPIKSINRYLYSKFFMVLGYKNCAFVYVSDGPTVHFDYDEIKLECAIMDHRNVQITHKPQYKIYSSIKIRPMGNVYEPVEIGNRESIILANNNIVKIGISQLF